MFLTGHGLNYGAGRIDVDDKTMAVLDAFRAKQGSLFASSDFGFPRQCVEPLCPLKTHVVCVTVLGNGSRLQGSDSFKKSREVGFGINSIMCMQSPPRVQTSQPRPKARVKRRGKSTRSA